MRHKAMYRCVAVALIVLFTPWVLAQEDKDVKLALIADKAFDLHKSPLVSLLEVRLSQKEHVLLLERAQIDKLLQEQKLSIAGLRQRDTVLKLGRLLRADAFLLLSIENGKDEKKDEEGLLRVRLVETAHALRLLDSFEQLDNTKPLETAERIAGKVFAVAGKLLVAPDKAIPVGIVDIHRVQLGERYGWLTRTLPGMLSVRLSKEPRIIMLEREDLKTLYDEKLLTAGEDTSFWNSAVLIDGYLQRKGTKNVEMKLQLRRPLGKEIAGFTVLVEPNQPWMAVDEAGAGIIRKLLDSPPTTSWDLNQEAEEFFRQANLLSRHKRYEPVLPLLEIAHALQPQNVHLTWELFRHNLNARSTNEWRAREWSRRTWTPIPCYSELELAETVSLLVRQIQAEYENGSISAWDVLCKWGLLLGLDDGGYFASPRSVVTNQVRYMNRQSRTIWAQTIHKASEKRPDFWYKPVDVAWASSDVPEEVIANIREASAELLMPPEKGGRIQSPDKRYLSCRQVLLGIYRDPERTQMKSAAERFHKLWRQYLEELINAGDSIVKFVGCLALTENLLSSGDEDQARQYCYQAVEIMRIEFRTPYEPFTNHVRGCIRGDMKRYLGLAGVELSEIVAILEEFCEPLIEKKDANNLVLWRLYEGLLSPHPTPEAMQRYTRLLARVVGVLEHRRDDKEVMEAANQLKDRLAVLTADLSPSDLTERPENLSATMLLTEEHWPPKGLHYLGQPRTTFKVRLHEHLLWTAFNKAYGSNSLVVLAGIDLVGKKLSALWQTELIHKGQITGLVIGRDARYVAINGLGLVAFPGHAEGEKAFFKNPRILTEKDGLTSVSITSMAAVGSKLWLAYGGRNQESGLGIYDSRSGHWETLFCSTLKGNPPFDADYPFRLYELTFASPDKLFFTASAGSGRSGFYKIDTNTRKLTRLASYFPGSEHIVDFEPMWWLKGGSCPCLMQFDPDSEKSKLMLWDSKMLEKQMSRISDREGPSLLEWDSDPFVPESCRNSIPFGLGGLNLYTCAIHGDNLWARFGESRLMIIRRGNGLDDAQIIENNILDGGKVLEFLSTPYGLIAIGEGTVGLIETEINEK